MKIEIKIALIRSDMTTFLASREASYALRTLKIIPIVALKVNPEHHQ